jgi:hypothetical protein
MIDLYLQTTSRADCVADLVTLGLVTIPTPEPRRLALPASPALIADDLRAGILDEAEAAKALADFNAWVAAGSLPAVELAPFPVPDHAPIAGVAFDYIGPMAKTPAVLDLTEPRRPVETTPAVFYDGERANLRLYGPDAEMQAAAIHAASPMPHGTIVLDPAPAQPKRVWA